MQHLPSKRSHRQPSVLTFLAQDADGQGFCYSNADLRKGVEPEEIFRFIAFWTRHHGAPPRHLVFDSKLTTYDRLERLDAGGIVFITLRRRSPKLLAEVAALAPSVFGHQFELIAAYRRVREQRGKTRVPTARNRRFAGRG